MGLQDRPKAYHETASPYFDVSNKSEKEKDGFVRSIGVSSNSDLWLVLLAIGILVVIYLAAKNGAFAGAFVR